MKRFFTYALGGVLAMLPACESSKPIDLEAFRERVEETCAKGCEQHQMCAPGDPFATYDECYEHCTGWDAFETPNQCASRALELDDCSIELSCEDYASFRSYEPTDNVPYPCDEAERRFVECRRSKEYGT